MDLGKAIGEFLNNLNARGPLTKEGIGRRWSAATIKYDIKDPDNRISIDWLVGQIRLEAASVTAMTHRVMVVGVLGGSCRIDGSVTWPKIPEHEPSERKSLRDRELAVAEDWNKQKPQIRIGQLNSDVKAMYEACRTAHDKGRKQLREYLTIKIEARLSDGREPVSAAVVTGLPAQTASSPDATHILGELQLAWSPRRQDADWARILDGRPLSANDVKRGGAPTRHVQNRYGVALAPAHALDFLNQGSGAAVLLVGDRGDGKTSYISLLESKSEGLLFVEYLGNGEDFDIDAVSRLQSNWLDATDADALVLVCRAPLYARERFDAAVITLATQLAVLSLPVTLLIECRPHDETRLAHRLVCEVWRLLSPTFEDADEWIACLTKSFEHLAAKSDTAALQKRYPNLPRFMSLPLQEQRAVLLADDDPMLVRLLYAIYGPDMPKKLQQELTELPEQERLAYILICLATLTGASVPEWVVHGLAPEQRISDRADRDPWVLSASGEHEARHEFIANVVIEFAGSSQPLAKLLQAACAHLLSVGDRDSRYIEMLGQIGLVLEDVSPSYASDPTVLRRSLRRSVRSAIIDSDPSVAVLLVRSRSRGHQLYVDWLELCRTLIPQDSRDPKHIRLTEIARCCHKVLVDVFHVSPERSAYYGAKLSILEERLAPSDPDVLATVVHTLRRFIGSEWCRGDFYHDLFVWSERALDDRLQEGVTDEEADAEGRLFLTSAIQAFEYLLSYLPPSRRKNQLRATFGTLMLRTIEVPWPHDAAAFRRDAWNISVSLGTPDIAAGLWHVDDLLDGRLNDTLGVSDGTTAAKEVILQILRYRPGHATALYKLSGIDLVAAASACVDIDIARLPAQSRACIATVRGMAARTDDEKVLWFTAASHDFALYVADSRYRFEREAAPWDTAVRELQRLGAPGVERLRSEYRATASNANHARGTNT